MTLKHSAISPHTNHWHYASRWFKVLALLTRLLRKTLALAAVHAVPEEGTGKRPAFTACWLCSVGNLSFIADMKSRNFLLMFQITNQSPFLFCFVFLNPSPADEELWPRCWFYPLTANNSRSNALVVLCHAQSQKTVAPPLFFTSTFVHS